MNFGSGCSFKDCLWPCLITFFVTLFLMGIVHVIIYFKLVSMAKRRFGINEGFSGNLSFPEIL